MARGSAFFPFVPNRGLWPKRWYGRVVAAMRIDTFNCNSVRYRLNVLAKISGREHVISTALK